MIGVHARGIRGGGTGTGSSVGTETRNVPHLHKTTNPDTDKATETKTNKQTYVVEDENTMRTKCEWGGGMRL